MSELNWQIVPHFIDVPCPNCGDETRASIALFDNLGEIYELKCKSCAPELVQELWNPK